MVSLFKFCLHANNLCNDFVWSFAIYFLDVTNTIFILLYNAVLETCIALPKRHYNMCNNSNFPIILLLFLVAWAARVYAFNFQFLLRLLFTKSKNWFNPPPHPISH